MGERRFFSAVSAVLFLAVCAYAAARFYSHAAAADTAVLSFVRITESASLDGIAVRAEQTVKLSGADLPRSANGCRIPEGTVLGAYRGCPVLSPCSAVWFDDCDGFEYLSSVLFPDGSFSPDAADFDAALVRRLLSSRADRRSCSGRLVTDHVWYYAALCGDEGIVPVCGDCELQFDLFPREVSARLVCVSPCGESGTALLFRLTEGDASYLSLRRCKARLILSRHAGLSAPPEALVSDADGNTFVSCLTVSGVQAVPVDVLYKESDRVLLSSPYLREGSRILVEQQVNYGYS